MHRLLDFRYDEAFEVASRVAMQIHRTVDDAFPNVDPSSNRFSKTIFSSNEDTSLNRAPINVAESVETKPKVQPIKTAPAKAVERTTPENSDIRDLAPSTDNGPGEFTRLDTMSTMRSKRPSTFKRALIILILVGLLSAGVAYFVHRFLVI